jgi:hypothetical protein
MQTRLCIVSIGIGKDNASDSDVRVYRRGRTVLLVEQFYFAATFAVVVEVLRDFVLAHCSKRLRSPHNRLHTKKVHPPTSPLPSESQCTRLATSESDSAIALQLLAVYNAYLQSKSAIESHRPHGSPNLVTAELQQGIPYLDAAIANNGRVAH